MNSANTSWAKELFNKSPAKQAKLENIVALLPDLEGKTCLDIGGDNGVISYLLRLRGGRWYSADLDDSTVTAIQQLVKDDVYKIDGTRTPFEDELFDVVVIVDFLEHIDDDHAFISELARIMKPGGVLIVNVPHLKPHSLINRFRHLIGLTDEAHGHVRPGYSREALRQVRSPHFTAATLTTYSRSFSELVDMSLNGSIAVLRALRGEHQKSRKGTVVTGNEWKKHTSRRLLLALAYPLISLLVWCDRLLFSQEGYKLIGRARRTDSEHGPV